LFMAIYLDHNAGSPLRPEVREAIVAALEAGAGNPSSVHRHGQRARRLLEDARRQVAASIGAQPGQIVFCSGGTEANNLAIAGAMAARAGRRRVVTSSIEHSSILRPLERLESGDVEVIRAAPDREGRLDPGEIAPLVDSATALVSLGLANSEVGTIQDLVPMAAAVHAAGAVFHIDAAQALGRMALDVAQLGCDLMTLSGHKIGAPAGIGALFVRHPTAIVPQLAGGPQEHGLRAGTQNLIGAIAFGAAAAAVRARLDEEITRITQLRDTMLTRLMAAIPGLAPNSPAERALPNTLNLAFPGVLGETMLIALDLEGVEVSMGSACAAGAVEPSHVLLAMGRSTEVARSSLRISLGWSTTAAEVERACAIIVAVWRRIAHPDNRSAVAAS
jgi:cysteine desulfurase